MMRHDDARPLLHDLVDGRLAPAARAAVAAHADACQACARELAELRALRDAAAALPAGVPPADDLWPGIAARLGDPDVRRVPAAPAPARRPRLTWLAAAVVAAALLAPWLRPDAGPSPAAAALDVHYDAMRRDGEALLDSDRLSPAAAAELRDGMGVIDRAVLETREALDRAAGAPDQFRRLTAGYHRKIDLLQQLVDRAARP